MIRLSMGLTMPRKGAQGAQGVVAEEVAQDRTVEPGQDLPARQDQPGLVPEVVAMDQLPSFVPTSRPLP